VLLRQLIGQGTLFSDMRIAPLVTWAISVEMGGIRKITPNVLFAVFTARLLSLV